MPDEQSNASMTVIGVLPARAAPLFSSLWRETATGCPVGPTTYRDHRHDQPATSRSFPDIAFPDTLHGKRLNNPRWRPVVTVVDGAKPCFQRRCCGRLNRFDTSGARLVWATRLGSGNREHCAGCRCEALGVRNPAGGDFRSDVR